ncbi:hypothetical protein EUX98_g4391 [Antrodiella citrinella]|uniref:BTB domain-containing protein n=1 Tax=Antrodiella citrinella TaxID=2447956 RepID=A0A4S4MU57_9APHY|nr:hypothetical protein EUX98_g4391 [Antrodiella citrinella]
MSSAPHPQLYFADGDIILSAALDATGVQQNFRVHKFMLSHNSTVFSDILSIPLTGSDADPIVDGVPLMALQDDAADLECLLNMLYNPATALPYERLHSNTAVQVMGALRMARKYQIDTVFDRIVKHIERDWPTTLDQLTLLDLEMTFWRDRYVIDAKEGKINGLYFDDRFPEPGSAIRLAKDFGITSILPYAFLCLAQIDPAMEWDAVRGTHGPVDEKLRQKLMNRGRSARWDLLDREDLRCLLIGMRQLRDQSSTLLVNLYGKIPIIECANHRDGPSRTCREDLRLAMQQRFESGVGGQPSFINSHPLQLLDLVEKHVGDCKMCQVCKQAARLAVHRSRAKTWEKLSSAFMLKQE